MHHYELRAWINENELAVDSFEDKNSPYARLNPYLISIPVERGGNTRGKVGVPRSHCGRVDNPLARYELASLPHPIMSKKPCQSGVISQHRVETAVRHLLSSVDGPRGFGFRPDGLPDLLTQIVGNRSPDGFAQNKTED